LRLVSGGGGITAMSNYSSGFKSRMVQRMAGPESISANALSKEVGVAQGTLSRWLRNGRILGGMSKKKQGNSGKSPRRTVDDKLRIVMEAASLSGDTLGEFLRREGVHEAQLNEWREKVVAGATGALKDAKRKKSEQTPEARKIRELESELRRKEKALAEAAALLILKKKWTAYLEERDGDTNTRRET